MSDPSSERWRRISSLFDEAVKLSAAERSSFLERTCGEDADSKARVLELLHSADRAPEFLEKPLLSDAGQLLRQAADLIDSDSHPPATADPEAATTRSLSGSGAPSETIGPYRLHQKIGEGGMGEVWLAEQSEPIHRQVALKVIKAGLDTKQVVARFEAERQALALMDHPGIAKVYEAGETPRGLPYFAMEYVKGEPITTYCDRHRLGTPERIELFARVCEAVQHAHQKGVIHRDLKPSNVLVSIVGDKPLPKVIDFGVAKATAQRLTEKTMFTELGVLIGTPEYMSPEQAEMTGLDIDTRTDVYALGVMLYELLTGALPFESKELRQVGFEEIRRRIREVDPPKPSTKVRTQGEHSTEAAKNRQTDPGRLASRLRGDLDWIVMKALEKDRTRRYGTPSEMAADLQRHLQHEPVLAGPPSAAYRARKFVRRHRFGVAVAGLAVAGLAAFGIVMAVQARTIARERDRAERVSEFLVELFRVSDPSEARGNSITAREVLDRGAARIERELRSQPLVQARMMATLGRVYRDLGLWKKSEPLLRQAVDLFRRQAGPKAPDTLGVLGDLAHLLQLQGHPAEAERIDRETVEGYRRIEGDEGPNTLNALHRLGVDLEKQGRLDEAEKIIRQVLEARRRVNGPEHVLTLWSTQNLAAVLWLRGEMAEAEEKFKLAAEGMSRQLGEDHPDTLWVKHNLAGVIYQRGRFAAAEKLYQEVLETRTRVLGPENPHTMATQSNLANVILDLGRKEEAAGIYRRLMQISERVRGPDHPTNFYLQLNLSSVEIELKDYDEAERLVRQAIAGLQRVQGTDSLGALTARINLGCAHIGQGRLVEAEKALLQAREELRKTNGPRSPDVLEAEFCLAGLEAVRGNRPRALEWLRSVVEAGFSPDRLAQDEFLRSLRGTPELAALIETARRGAGGDEPGSPEDSPDKKP